MLQRLLCECELLSRHDVYKTTLYKMVRAVVPGCLSAASDLFCQTQAWCGCVIRFRFPI